MIEMLLPWTIESQWERVATLEEIVAEQVAKDTGLEVVKS
jgi:hypothetical protein